MPRIEMMFITLIVLALGALAHPSSASQSATQAEAAEPVEEDEVWAFSLSAYTYIIEDDEDYVQTTFTADYDWLHLEARHQYEDLDTASIWIGYNLSFGDEFTLDLTPMVGGVFGDTEGGALGYEITLGWRQLELYTEGEVVFDEDDSSEDFFYSWSELTWAPLDWLRAGLAAQRTKIRAAGSDVEIGPMVGLTYEFFDFSAYLLYPDEGDPTVVLGFGVEF